VSDDRECRVSALQMRLGPLPVQPRTRIDYLRVARWWLLEALRGYPSSERSRQYAVNLRAKAWELWP
jgi:hypothetical protein